MEPVLEVADLTIKYRTVSGDRVAVNCADLTVGRGEVLGLAGESGSGKSSLAVAILRLLRAPGFVAGGRAIFHGSKSGPVDLLSIDDRALRRLRWSEIAYLPQGSMNALNPVMRVRNQFRDVMEAHRHLTRAEADERTTRLLAEVGLEASVARSYPHELSGGMRQRVLLAMSVALEPALLVADEPTTALDVTAQRLVLQTLGDLREKLGLSVLFVSHDLGVHAQMADRLAVMVNGRIVETGDVRQVLKQPQHEYTRKLVSSVPRVGPAPSETS
jgi:peptide/nickel transport system ATP-binding protein